MDLSVLILLSAWDDRFVLHEEIPIVSQFHLQFTLNFVWILYP